MDTQAKQRLKEWSNRILDDAKPFPHDEFWRPVWERSGKQRCVHCGRPIYCDNGSGSLSSGYYFHIEKTDGMNGLYCSAPFGKGKTAFPRSNNEPDEKEIALAIREFLNDR